MKERYLTWQHRYKVLLALLALVIVIDGCGTMTFVRNLKPPPLIKTPELVLPLSVAVVVTRDMHAYQTTRSLLEGDRIYIFRSLPNFYVQCLLARFEEVEMFEDESAIPDTFNLRARMSVKTEEKKLNWAVTGYYTTFTLSLADNRGRPVLEKSILADGPLLIEASSPEWDEKISQSIAKVFAKFGEEIDRAEALKQLVKP